MTVGLARDDEAGSVVQGPVQYPVVGAQRIGPYRLIQPLGEGGMGVVYLALDPKGRAVAIKVLREHIAHDREARDRLRREFETLELVRHPRVAAVLDADTEGARPYIVTRYIPGPALDRVVSENGPLQGEALLRLGRGLWEALKAIHGAGVIHRDLKPANVVLLDGDPVVIDFGIAHVADDIRLTMTGLVMGTPGYLSPEVVHGAPVTEATDWWGWAATLAFAASGAPPFGRGPMDVVLDRVRRGQSDLSGVDARLRPLLAAALSPTPSRRPQADAVVKALDEYAAGAPPTVALPVTGVPPTVRPTAGSSPQGVDPAPTGIAWQDWNRDTLPQPANTADPQAARQVGPRQPAPPVGGTSRRGTTLALAVAVLGVASIWPMVAIVLVALWSLLARFADRSITSLVMRRHDRGLRRSDIPLTIVASPWHAVLAALTTLTALVIPVIVAVGATFSVGIASASITGGNPAPGRSVPLVVGGLLGLVVCWWGPGGVALKRGSRSLLRAVAPGKGASDFVVGMLLLIGVGLGAWAWVRNGQPEWWPWSLDHFQAISRSFW
jgi:predicted Ser/Thr protein kinase